MGIQGLLPLLKDIQVKENISSYAGQTVGIDAYCWLHKGAYGCAFDIAVKKPTKIYVNYIMRRIDMLINHNVTPILVFDGGHLPAKAETEKVRRSRKKQHRERGMAALKEGNTKEACENFQRCIDITPEMASEVIQECYSMNVQCIVAPYEADAQLAYLMKEGITQLTISEDSDLLLYGCNKVMYKMSIDGEGFVIDLENLPNVRTIQLASFTEEKFRHMCMLSGCDYLPSIKGMGLMKAFKSLRRFSTVFQCIRSLKCDKAYTVPKDYDENFRKADLVFKYQLVFDIRTKSLTRLNTIDDLDVFGDTEKKFAGPKIDDGRGLQIALGNIDPINGKILSNRPDFASGDISQKTTMESTGPDKSTAFRFHGHSQQSSQDSNRSTSEYSQISKTKPDDKEVFNNSPVTATSSPNNLSPIAPSPNEEVNKSLKRLREEVSVPTREEKIRKLYKEDDVETPVVIEKVNNNTEPVALDKGFVRRHHNVFSNKPRKFKNPFKQVNQPSNGKVVVSRFFSDKIAIAKENTVLQVDTPPEKVISNTTESKDSQHEGSFLDYLDKTNVRGYEVKVLTLDSNEPKQKPKEEPLSPKKTKKANVFSLIKKQTEKSICSKLVQTNDDNVDFRITIPLDEAGSKRKKKKEKLNLFSHFQHKSVDESIELLKSNLGDEGEEIQDKFLSENENIANKREIVSVKDMDVEIVEDDPSVSNSSIISNILNSSCTSIKRTNLKLGLSKSNSKGSLSSWSNMFLHSKCKTKNSNAVNFKPQNSNVAESLNVDDAENEGEIIKSTEKKYDEISCNTKSNDGDASKEEDEEPDLLFDLCKNDESVHIDKISVDDEQQLNVNVQSDKEEDLLFSAENDDTVESVELHEEPLPSHLIDGSTNVKHYIGHDKEENKVVKTAEVVYLDDEEPLPFHVKNHSELSDLVRKSALQKISSKRCKPVGLRRKRKSLEKSLGDDKLKQMTFDRFAYKKKSVRESKSEEIICLT